MVRRVSLIGLIGATLLATVSAQAQSTTQHGELRTSDAVDAENRTVDTHDFSLQSGQSIEFEAQSSDLDLRVMVDGPNQFRVENDDISDSDHNARVAFVPLSGGVYHVRVFSYEAHGTGNYSLVTRLGSSIVSRRMSTVALPEAPVFPVPLSVLASQSTGGNRPNSFQLRDTDPTNSEHCHYQTSSISLTQGETVRVRAQSTDFDTVLRVQGPNGFVSENDDVSQGNTNSVVRFTAPATGVYQVTLRSYSPSTVGEFELVTEQGAAARTPLRVANSDLPSRRIPKLQRSAIAQSVRGTGTVYGVFVGVSNYADQSQNLEYTANDARLLANTFIKEGTMLRDNAIVLTDSDATHSNVVAALQLMAAKVTEQDTLVFFFDGHGDKNLVSLHSGSLTARTLSEQLDHVAGQQLIVLDSCNSGGLASVVRGRPNRIGLFSSRASELSSVASDVRSGGWLAYFVLRAMHEPNITGGDNALQWNELLGYVQREFNDHVQGQHLAYAVGGGTRNATLWTLPKR